MTEKPPLLYYYREKPEDIIYSADLRKAKEIARASGIRLKDLVNAALVHYIECPEGKRSALGS